MCFSIAKIKGIRLGSSNVDKTYQTVITYWRATVLQGGFQTTSTANWKRHQGKVFR